MYYLIGDIHGYIHALSKLFTKIRNYLNEDDTLIFLGDYIDRGEYSYEVIDFLIAVSRAYKSVFLKGNHEAMLLDYVKSKGGKDVFLYNGGDATVRSYKKNCGSFSIPKNHMDFYNNLQLYYETDDFIAVHAGLDPNISDLKDQPIDDMLWIRDRFFRNIKKWPKTVIFGHTPSHFISRDNPIYIDEGRNIIGIDSGIIYGKTISCLRWPDKKIFSSE